MKNKIIFLDRDGVLNKKPQKATYVTTSTEYTFLPGAIEGLKLLQEKGYEIFIITNQAGVARGLVKEEDLLQIHEKILEECKKVGVLIRKIYYCPHGWDEGCSCRKPKPGMLLTAAKEYGFDMNNAIFIGDDERDMEAGTMAGCKTLLMESNGNLFDMITKSNIA